MIFKSIYKKFLDYKKKERLKAINSCWYCKHRKTPSFEMFECGVEQVWVDGRGFIGRIIGLSPWKEYVMDALKVKGYKCKLYERGI